MSGDARTLALLRDREAIREGMLDYAAAVDRRDFDDVAAGFTPDVHARYGEQHFENRDDLIAFISGVAFFHTTLHGMGNHWIEVAPDRARATMTTTAMLTHHGTREDGRPFQYDNTDGSYVDVLVREGDRWLVEQRGGEPVEPPSDFATSQAEDPTLRRLADLAAIHDLAVAHWRRVDTRRYDDAARDFDADGTLEHEAGVARGRDAIEAALSELARHDVTTHFLAAPLVAFDDDGATVEHTALVTLRAADEKRPTSSPHRFRERLVRRDGRWKIAARDASALALPDGPGPDETGPAGDLATRQRVRDRVGRLLLALDARDDATVRALLTDGAEASLDGRREVDAADALVRHATRHPAITHHVVSQRVWLRDEDALVESYVYVSGGDASGALVAPWTAGARRVRNRLVREGGDWRIATHVESDTAAATLAASDRFPTWTERTNDDA